MIQVENLTKKFGTLCALDSISFDIRKGEILGMLGPNGAGKTTCMRILTCYLKPTAGNIKVKDFDVLTGADEVKKLIGYLPESAPLYPDMLVFDYLNFTADVRKLEKEKKSERVKYLADICGVKEVMHQPISELSKGYKQRVGLAQAMMSDPEILVLDEPTSGLDPNQIIEIREIIKEIGKEKTVILCTHILSEAEATCDRVVIINNGKIVADGNIQSLKQSVGKESIVHLSLRNAEFEAVNRVLGEIAGVSNIEKKESVDDVINVGVNCTLDKDLRADIYRAIKNQEWIVLEFRQEVQSLENIFRALTKEN
ncbi:MAG: hypothetical protein A2Y62_03620 [Candidatus Fischerbacteria bacterium RBG_13_37_8]|uniref:ABC transporter domain-containing protein n=1 Tax=Candidatus Fischerbacteria bacterium RBG_13_37_8 TaxID=1817863 RepID=A0A1F5V7Y7_9BACT|nr:MAG: hypothetical protein A2Y62_03620 [Candidatus Fischerbacteria bacterium RBG_13_37_8]